MARFQKKASSAQTVENTATVTAPSINLTQRLIDLETELLSAGINEDKIDIPDQSLPEDIRGAFNQLAAKLGFTEYNPDGCTCVFVKNDNGGYLATPAVYAYEDGICIRWGQQRFVIPNETVFPSDLYALNLGDDTLILDPSGYALVCPVRLQYEYRSEDGRKLVSARLSMANTPEKLTEFLLRGEERVEWGDVEDGSDIEFAHIKWVPKRDKEGEFYGSILGVVGEKPVLFYAPGNKEDWVNFSIDENGWFTEELTVSKEGKKLSVNGHEFELTGGNYMKLSELSPEAEYKVVGYKKTQGKFGDGVEIYVIVDGSEKTINGNTYIKRVLSGSTTQLSIDAPAILSIDRIEEMKNKNKRVICRLRLPESSQSSFVAGIKARIAENSKAPQPAAI